MRQQSISFQPYKLNKVNYYGRADIEHRLTASTGAGLTTSSLETPPAGYLWDQCARQNLSYRSYGEYTHLIRPDAPPGPVSDRDEGATSLKGHASDAWIVSLARGSRDTEKAAIFISELRGYERSGDLPRFTVMSLGEDHTQGTTPGASTPKAAVASNDQALGQIVAACSESRFWKQMAIFVIEDDAQNGPDHVDAHRTVAFAISPYIQRGTVDSTFYTTSSLLRTIELILGLGPMSQYDAAATPLYHAFGDHANLAPYRAVAPRIDLNARNTATAYGARDSARIDFGDYDRLSRVEEDTLNRVLWHSIKGENSPYPGRSTAFLRGGPSF